MEFRVLGAFEVVEADRPVAVGGPKQRALLALLVLHRGEVVSSDRLIDELWGERPPATAAKTVQVFVSSLRKALGDGLLVTRGRGYVLDVAPGQLDLDRFEELAAEGRSALQAGDPQRAASRLREGLGLWRGPPLADFTYEPFAEASISRLEEERLGALEDRIDADLALRRHERLIGELSALVAENPLRERMRGQLMLALYRCGRQAEALEVYQELRRVLAEELGLDPSARLQQLEAAVLQRDPSLDLHASGGIDAGIDGGSANVTTGPDAPVLEARAGGFRTFLLADIRGYSSFAASRGDEAAAALTERFVALADGVVSDFGGVNIGTRGDEVLIAFESPRQAIRAAVAFQQALLEATQEDPTLPMPAGIGLDVGEAVIVSDGWRANAINVAARLCSLAKGGEILATKEVTHLAQAIDGVSYTPRPATRVKGIAAPVNPVRVVADAGDTAGAFARLGFTHAQAPPPHPWLRRGGPLIAAGGALLLAAIALLAVMLSESGGRVRVAPNSVAAVDPQTNRVVGAIPVGTRPGAISPGAGSLWIANQDDQTVSRVDPRALQTLQVIPVGETPTGIAAGADQIWVATANLTPSANAASVTRIDPRFNSPTPVPIGNVITGATEAVAAQGDQVWAAPGAGLLTRLDGSSGRIVQQLDPNASPTAIAIGGDGAVWITDNSANNVTRVDPTGLLTPIAVGNGPNGIAVGEGGVWVADTLDNAVVRLDSGTRAVTTTIPVGNSPAGVAVGAGSVWVANSGDGTVDRIDPLTDKVIAKIPVGASPQALTVASGRVWVTVDAASIPAARPPGGATLRIDWPAGPESMDPALAYEPQAIQLLQAMCAKLLNFPDKSGPAGARPTPEVAQSLPAISAGGRTYTFKIRPGFRFSPPSNEPVTAETFKDSLERALNPAMKSEFVPDFSDIVGMSAYEAGKAPHIAGIVARGDTLVLRLVAPRPDLGAWLTEPAACAVPSDTPLDPNGVDTLPSAGPYYLQSFTPGGAIVLVRNPNYHGSRPHDFERIEVATGMSTGRAVAAVKATTADYTSLNWANGSSGLAISLAAEASRLAAEYGPGSAAAAHGGRQFFVNPLPGLDYFILNTHRPLFSDVRMRQAVNYAIDRTALAALGGGETPLLPDHLTDHYLPPGIPGYRDVHVYPLAPDLAKATALANGHGRTAILDTANFSPLPQQAQIVKNDLAAIGLRVQVETLTLQDLIARESTPGARPFDLAWVGWNPDYPDPYAMLNAILEDDSFQPTFNDPTYERKLAAAARLSGPKRYLTYGKLDLDLARNAAPLAAFGNTSTYDFFSAQIGCQTFGFYGIDLNALCIRRTAHP